MSRDFRIGLIAGVILAIIALVWVATRPSLSPQARMARSAQVRSRPDDAMPWETARTSAAPDETGVRQGNAPADNAAALPEPVAAEPAPEPAPPPMARPQPPVTEASGPSVPDYALYERAEPIKTTRFHIVRKGENLSLIARQYYGSATGWRKILSANQKTIKDPNKITPGTKLVIPD